MIKSKTTLASGEGISKVLTITNQNNVYEATPSEVMEGATPSPAVGAIATQYTLEESSSPAINLSNRGAAELYQAQMGGYMLLIKSGKVYAAKLNGSNWNRFADGTPVSNPDLFECMVHVPDCHFKGQGKHMDFGGLTPIDGGKTFGSPHWVGAYLMGYPANGSNGTNDWHSRPGYKPAHSKTMQAFWDRVQANLGSEWGLANYGFFCLINALYQARYGNLNSQATIGAGFQHSNWEACRDVPTGLLKHLGDGSGSVLYNDSTLGDQYPVKLFGFEDLWGKLWEFRPGIRFYMDGQTRKAVVYNGNIVSNTVSNGDAAFDHEFECLSAASGSYIVSMQCGEFWDMICQSVSGGSATTYYCDGYWAATGGELLFVGGSADYGAHCGLSISSSDSAFSYSDPHIGARLAFYGEPEIVSGAELVALAA